jgi:hypothetical protein
MAQTAIPTGSGLAPKKWNDALYTQAGRMRTPTKMLSGPEPDITKMGKILRRQSTTDMPIMRSTALDKGAGDTVRTDLAHIIKMRAIMGDANAEGLGAKLDFSYRDTRIDMATIPVSAGGTMTQKRMQHELRLIALQQLRGAVPLFDWQRNLVAMAGARGDQNDVSWILPMATDPEFLSQMVNAPRAPTYNRHFVVSGNTLVQGGQQLATIASADVFKLSHADDISEIISEMTMRVLPVRVPGDDASDDDPIKAIMLHDNLSWSRLIRENTTANNLRQWQTDAMKRAEYGNMKAHPLFAPGSFLWNGVLHRRLGDFGIRFLPGSVTKHVTAANRYTGSAANNFAPTETDVTVNAALGAGFQVARSVVLGAQALMCCNGINYESGVPYSMLENQTNFKRNYEMAGELIGGCDKLTFGMPDGQGNIEPTDIGVIVIDSAVPRLTV